MNWNDFCKEFCKKLWKNSTWNIRLLVDESFIQVTQRPSILYWKMLDFWIVYSKFVHGVLLLQLGDDHEVAFHQYSSNASLIKQKNKKTNYFRNLDFLSTFVHSVLLLQLVDNCFHQCHESLIKQTNEQRSKQTTSEMWIVFFKIWTQCIAATIRGTTMK